MKSVTALLKSQVRNFEYLLKSALRHLLRLYPLVTHANITSKVV